MFRDFGIVIGADGQLTQGSSLLKKFRRSRLVICDGIGYSKFWSYLGSICILYEQAFFMRPKGA